VPSVSADWGIALALVLGAVGAYLPFLGAEFDIYDVYDAGLAVYGAERVADGLVPYADGYTIYGPAQYQLRAGVFRLFGFSMGVFQREIVITGALFVGIAYLVLRGCAGRWMSLTLTLVACVALSVLLRLGGINLVAFVCLLVGVGGLTRYALAGAWPWLVIGGSAAGLCIAEQWVFGLSGLLVLLAAAVAAPYLQRFFEPKSTLDSTPRAHSRRFAALLIPAALVALPFYAPAIVEDPGAIAKSVRLHLAARESRVLPYPIPPNPADVVTGEWTVRQYVTATVKVVPAYAFPVLGLLNVVAIVVTGRHRDVLQPAGVLVLYTGIMTLLGAMLFEYGRGRADIPHTLPSALFMVLSLPLSIDLLRRPLGRNGSIATGLRLTGVVLTLAIVLPVVGLGASKIRAEWSEAAPNGALTPPRLWDAETDRRTDRIYNGLIAYIRDHTADDELIFSGVVDHDRLFINDLLVYFATDRHAGVWDFSMDPGTTTTAPVQRRIVNDLRRNRVRLVVLLDIPIPRYESIQENSGVTILDDYIAANYVKAKRFGPYTVLLPRSEVRQKDSSADRRRDPGARASRCRDERRPLGDALRPAPAGCRGRDRR
jgi:hypothetical protein